MRRFSQLALLPLALLVAVACAKPEDKVVGTWQGATTIKRPSTGNPSLDKQFEKLTNKVDYELVLRKDKTYTETIAKKNKIEGSWTLEQNNLSLEPKTVNGQDPEKVKADAERMMASLQIKLPLPEGTDGVAKATVADDFKSIQVPSIGTTATLTKAAN